jgi:Kef-type K+ transport system membrane component KefB
LASSTEAGHGFNAILILGIAIFGGTVGARIFQRLRIPQVIGYVLIGILLGPMVLKVIKLETVTALEPFNYFALGIIGFLVGGELKREIFVKFGKQALSILIFEGVTAFLLVGLLCFGITYIFTDNLSTAIAIGVVFGAICTATDPASTVQVLWEYKCRGELSTMLLAIVALDDALALFLYAIAVSIASIFTGVGDSSFAVELGHAFMEIAFSLGLGVGIGLGLTWILKHARDHEKILAFTISSVLICIGLSTLWHLDVIIVAMALGVTMINLAPRLAKVSFELVHTFSPPVYALFFVLVGARLYFHDITPMVVWLIAAYYLGSIIGKTSGSFAGSIVSGASVKIRNYLGFCLYPQGGIAVGLLIAASHRFDHEIAQIIVMVVVTGVFLLQITGPLAAKVGLGKAGEIGMNISEEDLIKTLTVADVADTKVSVIHAETPITEILQTFAETDALYYPVTDHKEQILGAITMDGVRNTFTTSGSNDWLIALDILEPITEKTSGDTPLAKVLKQAKKLEIENMPIISEEGKLEGVFNTRSANRKIGAIFLEKQRQSDALHIGTEA